MDNNWAKPGQTHQWEYSRADFQMLRTHLQNASGVFAISQPMKEHFLDTFGVSSEVLFAPSPSNRNSFDENRHPAKKLAYFGNLNAWPVDALARFVPYLKNTGYHLDIYSFAPLPPALNSPEVSKIEPLPHDLVQSRMANYAAVLLPMGFSRETSVYSHFNIATKMAECLGSGTVTFAVGPESAAMVRYLRNYKLGLVVSNLTKSSFHSALNRLSDPRNRSALIEAQTAHVRDYLNLSVTTQRFARASGLLV